MFSQISQQNLIPNIAEITLIEHLHVKYASALTADAYPAVKTIEIFALWQLKQITGEFSDSLDLIWVAHMM